MIQIYEYGEVPPEAIFSRQEELPDVSAAVAEIIAAVRRDGDAALRRYAGEFDKTEPEELEVPSEQLDRAAQDLDPDLRAILEELCTGCNETVRRLAQEV